MAAYLRNRRPERACGGAAPVPTPGWPANNVLRSIPRPGRERREPILRCLTIACWAAPAPEENFIRPGFARRRRTRQSAADAFTRRLCMVTGGAHLAEPGGNEWQRMFDDANL